MSFSNGVLGSIRETSRGDWWQATLLIVFSLLGGLAPLWMGALLATIFGRAFTLETFASSGEFAIYSASVLAPTFYTVLHERTANRISGQLSLVLVSLVLLLVAVTFYLAVVPAPSRVIQLKELDMEVYTRTCGALLIISVAFALLVTALDNARTAPDVRAIAGNQERSLRDQFEIIRGDP